jgi:hypothetical protein
VNRKKWKQESNRKMGRVEVDDMDVYEVEGSGGDRHEWRTNGAW